MSEPVRFLDPQGNPRYVSESNPLPTTGSGGGGGGGGGGGAVTVANGADVAQGSTTQAAATADGTGDYSLVQAAKRALLNWAVLLTRIPALVSGRVPVVSNVTLGSGAVDATTQRVALANDDAVATALITGNPLSATGSIAALDAVVNLNLNGQPTAVIAVSGTFSGTVLFEYSLDSGTSWSSLSGAFFSASGSNAQANTTGAATRVFNVANCTNVRARGNPWASGTANIIIRVSRNLSQISAFINGNVNVIGQTQRGGTASSSLLSIGTRAATAAPTAVTNGQCVDVLSDTQGRQIVRLWTIPELAWSYAAASGGIVNTSDVTLASAAGAGLRRYITQMALSNNSATATELVVKDGVSTVIARLQLPANAPNVVYAFSPPLSTSANAILNVACVTTGAAVYVNAQGFTAP